MELVIASEREAISLLPILGYSEIASSGFALLAMTIAGTIKPSPHTACCRSDSF